MNALDQERGIYPSASIMYRIAKCPGSWPPPARPEIEKSDPMRDRGTRVHALLESSMSEKPTSNEDVEIARLLSVARQQLLCEWLGGDTIAFEYAEKRFWRRSGNAHIEYSAKLDFAVVSGEDRALIIDYKTGFAPGFAKDDLQLLTQLACLRTSHFISEAKLILLKCSDPNKPVDESSSVLGERDINRALERIDHIVDTLDWNHDARAPGEWCRYCPHRGSCPELAGLSNMATVVVGNRDEPITERLKTLTHEQLADVWKRRITINHLMEAVEERLQELDNKELQEIGLRRVTRTTRKIVQPITLIEKLGNRFGVDVVGPLTNLLSLPLTRSVEIIAETLGTSFREANEAASTILDEHIDSNTGEPSIVAIKHSRKALCPENS